jgi:hypothetical protein
MVHSGFEASAVIDSFSSPRGMLAMIRALLFGPRSPRTEDVREPNARPAVAPAVLPQRGLDAEASPEALRAAFDYRGDVTLTLDDGSRVEGFVSDPGPEAIQFWPAGGETPVAIPAQRVRGVALSGRDPAARRHSEGIAAASA